VYDLQNDPDEVHDLTSPEEIEKLPMATVGKLGKAILDHIFEIRDLGFLPEDELHQRTAGISPYSYVRSPNDLLLIRIGHYAWLAQPAQNMRGRGTGEEKENQPLFRLMETHLTARLKHDEAAQRYWAALDLFCTF
jgi:hypothetical protein